MTGAQYLEGLRDDREIWINGERRQGCDNASGVSQWCPVSRTIV